MAFIHDQSLYRAALKGNNLAVIESLKQGADINSRHEHQATPLFAATHYNQTSIVQLLVNHGADLEITTDNGMTPLYKSARQCHSGITEILLKARANKESMTGEYTPLYAAISSGCVKDVELLLNYGAKTYSDNLETPVLLTSYNKNESPNHQVIHNLVMNHYWQQLEADLPNKFEVVVVRYQANLSWLTKEFKNENVIIYNKGDDNLGVMPSNYKVVNIPNTGWFGGTILYHLVENYDQLADRTLFLQDDPYPQHLFLPLAKYKANIASKCNYITANCVETTLLEQSKALSDLTQKDWETTKYANCFKLPNFTMVEFFHKYVDENIIPEAPLFMVWGAQFAVDKKRVLQNDKAFYQKMLPLFDEQCPTADFMLEKAWDAIFAPKNIAQLNRQLFEAAWAGNNTKVSDLLDQGADINSVHNLNATPVYAAAKNNQTETLKLLISKGANLEIPINTGATPLYAAAFNCYSDATKVLIEAGANQSITVDGWTPFWGAVYSGCPGSVEHFLRNGSVILWDNLRSPLYTAAKLRDESENHRKSYDILMNHYWKIVEDYPAIDQITELEVVVVRYQEDLHWIEKEFKTEKVIIYNKGSDDLDYLPSNCEVRNVPNVGWFGGTILHHIVHNYNNLGQRTLFLQGTSHDAEAFLPMSRYKGALNSSCTNIIAKCEQSTLSYYSDLLEGAWSSNQHSCFSDPRFSEPLKYTLIEFVHKYVNPSYDPTKVLHVDLGAQFAIDAKQVHIHSQDFYERILPFFNTTRCSRADYYIEKIWDIIFEPSSYDSKNFTELNRELFEAAWAGNNTKVIDLLDQGADINSVYNLNATPLYGAAKNNKTDTVKLLVERGANLEIALSTDGATPLYTAAFNCYTDIIKILLDAGAFSEVMVNGYSPLFVSIYSDCPKQDVEYFLKAGAVLFYDIVSSQDIHTPLFLNSFKQNQANKNPQTDEIYSMVLDHYYDLTEDKIKELDEKTANSSRSFEVVVVRYKEDLSWIKKEFPHEKITIYNKGPDDLGDIPSNWQVVSIENIGYLGGTYLKHIVDNYEHLADRTMFIQGHPYDANVFLPLLRHKDDVESYCKNIIGTCGSSTLQKEWDFLRRMNWDNLPSYKMFEPRDANMIEYTHKYIGNVPLNETIYVAYGAIFAVDKEKIHNCAREYYEAMLPEFASRYPMADHYQERLWDVLFEYCVNKVENDLAFL